MENILRIKRGILKPLRICWVNKGYLIKVVGLNGSLIIVGQHPQGKPTEPHFNEIMDEITKAR
jgi:hypothetical protein